MTADWTLIINWIIQGLILAGFAFIGVYVGLRVFARQRQTLAKPTPPEPSRPAPAPRVDTGAISKPGLAAATTGARRRPSRGLTSADEAPFVRHAFEFGEDDQLTMILEMPATTLDDDGALVETWVDVVGWARLERTQTQRGAPNMAGARVPAPFLGKAAEPEGLQAHLDEVLHRLQLSAERRRQLRALLDQNIAIDDTDV